MKQKLALPDFADTKFEERLYGANDTITPSKTIMINFNLRTSISHQNE